MDFRQDLVERFRDYTDDELLNAAQTGTLTALAQDVIEEELNVRNIAFVAAQKPDADTLYAPDMTSQPVEEHETVARFSNVINAHILRGRLESEGIPAYVLDANMATFYPIVLIESGVRLQVPRSFVAQAMELICAIDNGEVARELDSTYESPDQKTVPPFLGKEAALLAFSQDQIWIPIWRRMIDGKSRFAGFNPFAVILGPTWFFFRKMYGLGIAVVLIDVAVLYFVHIPGAFFVPRILFGLYGNIAYYRKAERAIGRVQAQPAFQAERYLKAEGGVSPVGALLSIFLIIGGFGLLGFLRR